jgi:hypothetical protein
MRERDGVASGAGETRSAGSPPLWRGVFPLPRDVRGDVDHRPARVAEHEAPHSPLLVAERIAKARGENRTSAAPVTLCAVALDGGLIPFIHVYGRELVLIYPLIRGSD